MAKTTLQMVTGHFWSTLLVTTTQRAAMVSDQASELRSVSAQRQINNAVAQAIASKRP
jgi:hypothetical protein